MRSTVQGSFLTTIGTVTVTTVKRRRGEATGKGRRGEGTE